MPAPLLRKKTRVLAPPMGCSTKTRLRVTDFELEAISELIEYTTTLRNKDLNPAKKREPGAVRRTNLRGDAASRLIDTIILDNDHLASLRRRNLQAERIHLEGAIADLDERINLPTRDVCKHASLEATLEGASGGKAVPQADALEVKPNIPASKKTGSKKATSKPKSCSSCEKGYFNKTNATRRSSAEESLKPA